MIEMNKGKLTSYRIIRKSGNWDTIGNNQNLISVIIPFFNQLKLLNETIQSLHSQTYQNFELVLVDDSSEKFQFKSLKMVLSKFTQPWILVRLDKNSGPGIARKIGLHFIRGCFIQYLDSDDIIHNNKFQAQVDFLIQNQDVSMTYGETVTFVRTIMEKQQILGSSDKKFTSILPHIAQRMIWTTSSCFWRSKSANQPDFWKSLRAGEDFVYEFLMGVKNIKVGKTPSNFPLVYKRSHSKSLSNNIYNDLNYQAEILKGYDILLDEVRSLGDNQDLITLLAELYREKIWFHLIHRTHYKIIHCIEKIKGIDENGIPIPVKIALNINKIFTSFLGFHLLRKWLWLMKIVNRIINSNNRVNIFSHYNLLIK